MDHSSPPIPDSLRTARIEWKRPNGTLRFSSNHDLFSSHQVDVGSQLLLRTLDSFGIRPGLKVLDVGCGYGPIGLALAKDYGHRVTFVDRDALAVAFTADNARSNGVDAFEAGVSLGYSALPSEELPYDLIVSNIPGKAGERMIRHLLLGAQAVLAPDGAVAVVVIKPIVDFVRNELASNDSVVVRLEREHPRYSVFIYQFSGEPEGSSKPIAVEDQVEHATTAPAVIHGQQVIVPELPGLASDDAFNALRQHLCGYLAGMDLATGVGSLHWAVHNPGSGHLAAFLAARWQRDMTLVDRDAWALLSSAQAVHLSAPGTNVDTHCVPFVQALAAEDLANVSTWVVVLREGEGRHANLDTVLHLVQASAPATHIVVAGSSTVITFIHNALTKAHMSVRANRTRHKGNSILDLVVS